MAAPADLTKSIFVGNMVDSQQVESLKVFLSENNIGAEIEFWKMGVPPAKGFMFLTPATNADYMQLVQLRMAEIDGNRLFFSSRNSTS